MDVYDDSPSISTIWLTIMPKISLFIFLLELYSHLTIFENIDYSSSVISVIKNILLISSLLSLIIGSVLGLSQVRIRRLLGYSTINHVGFLLLALSINTESSINSFIFYIIQYTLTNLNTFLILIAFGYIFNKFTFKLVENNNLKNIKIEYGTIFVNKNIDNIKNDLGIDNVEDYIRFANKALEIANNTYVSALMDVNNFSQKGNYTNIDINITYSELSVLFVVSVINNESESDGEPTFIIRVK